MMLHGMNLGTNSQAGAAPCHGVSTVNSVAPDNVCIKRTLLAEHCRSAAGGAYGCYSTVLALQAAHWYSHHAGASISSSPHPSHSPPSRCLSQPPGRNGLPQQLQQQLRRVAQLSKDSAAQGVTHISSAADGLVAVAHATRICIKVPPDTYRVGCKAYIFQ
jgi:hypothetical protein